MLTSLIPKKDCLEIVSQFLPIAFCNVLMKVVTKIIANRLKPLMNKLVGETKSSFILGKQAVDNIFIAQKVFFVMWR